MNSETRINDKHGGSFIIDWPPDETPEDNEKFARSHFVNWGKTDEKQINPWPVFALFVFLLIAAVVLLR